MWDSWPKGPQEEPGVGTKEPAAIARSFDTTVATILAAVAAETVRPSSSGQSESPLLLTSGSEATPLLLAAGETRNPLESFESDRDFTYTVLMGDAFVVEKKVPEKNLFGRVKEGKFKIEKEEKQFAISERLEKFMAQLPEIKKGDESLQAIFPSVVERILVQADTSVSSDYSDGNDEDKEEGWFTSVGELTKTGQMSIMLALGGYFQEAVNFKDSSYVGVLEELARVLGEYKEKIVEEGTCPNMSRETAACLLEAELATRLMLGNHLAHPSMGFEDIVDLSIEQRDSTNDIPAVDFLSLEKLAANYVSLQGRTLVPTEKAKEKRIFLGEDDTIGITVSEAYNIYNFNSVSRIKSIKGFVKNINETQGTNYTVRDFLDKIQERLETLYEEEQNAIKTGAMTAADASIINAVSVYDESQREGFLDNSAIDYGGLTNEERARITKSLNLLRLAGITIGVIIAAGGGAAIVHGHLEQIREELAERFGDDWERYVGGTGDNPEREALHALAEMSTGRMEDHARYERHQRYSAVSQDDWHPADSGIQPKVHREIHAGDDDYTPLGKELHTHLPNQGIDLKEETAKDFHDKNSTVNPNEFKGEDGHGTKEEAAPGCFIAGTKILLIDGEKNIEEIMVGDCVMAYDTEKSFPVEVEVINLIRKVENGFYRITTNKVSIDVTSEHPIYVNNGKFLPVRELKRGDNLKYFFKERIEDTEIISIQHIEGNINVFNLEVEAPHVFFANNILVHNKQASFLDTSDLDGSDDDTLATIGNDSEDNDPPDPSPGVQLTAGQLAKLAETGGKIYKLEQDLDETISHALAAKGVSQEQMYGADGNSGIVRDLQTHSYGVFTAENGRTYITLVVQDNPQDDNHALSIITPGQTVTRDGANVVFIEVDPDALSRLEQGAITTILQEVIHTGAVTEGNLQEGLTEITTRINESDDILVNAGPAIDISPTGEFQNAGRTVVTHLEEVDNALGSTTLASGLPSSNLDHGDSATRVLPINSDGTPGVDGMVSITQVSPRLNPDGTVGWKPAPIADTAGSLVAGSRLIIERHSDLIPDLDLESLVPFQEQIINNSTPPVEGRDYIRAASIEEGSLLRDAINSHQISQYGENNFVPSSTHIGTTSDGNWGAFAESVGLPPTTKPEFRNGVWSVTIFREDGQTDLVHFRAYSTGEDGTTAPVDSLDDGNLPPGTNIAIVDTPENVSRSIAVGLANTLVPVEIEEEVPVESAIEDITLFSEVETKSPGIASQLEEYGVVMTTPEGPGGPRVIQAAVNDNNEIVSGNSIGPNTRVMQFELDENEQPMLVEDMLLIVNGRLSESEPEPQEGEGIVEFPGTQDPPLGPMETSPATPAPGGTSPFAPPAVNTLISPTAAANDATSTPSVVAGTPTSAPTVTVASGSPTTVAEEATPTAPSASGTPTSAPTATGVSGSPTAAAATSTSPAESRTPTLAPTATSASIPPTAAAEATPTAPSASETPTSAATGTTTAATATSTATVTSQPPTATSTIFPTATQTLIPATPTATATATPIAPTATPLPVEPAEEATVVGGVVAEASPSPSPSPSPIATSVLEVGTEEGPFNMGVEPRIFQEGGIWGGIDPLQEDEFENVLEKGLWQESNDQKDGIYSGQYDKVFGQFVDSKHPGIALVPVNTDRAAGQSNEEEITNADEVRVLVAVIQDQNGTYRRVSQADIDGGSIKEGIKVVEIVGPDIEFDEEGNPVYDLTGIDVAVESHFREEADHQDDIRTRNTLLVVSGLILSGTGLYVAVGSKIVRRLKARKNRPVTPSTLPRSVSATPVEEAAKLGEQPTKVERPVNHRRIEVARKRVEGLPTEAKKYTDYRKIPQVTVTEEALRINIPGLSPEQVIARQLIRDTKSLEFMDFQQYALTYTASGRITTKYRDKEEGFGGKGYEEGKVMGLDKLLVNINKSVLENRNLPSEYIRRPDDYQRYDSIKNSMGAIVVRTKDGVSDITFLGSTNTDDAGRIANQACFVLTMDQRRAQEFLIRLKIDKLDVREVLREYIKVLVMDQDGNSMVPLNGVVPGANPKTTNPFLTLDSLFVIDESDERNPETFEIIMSDGEAVTEATEISPIKKTLTRGNPRPLPSPKPLEEYAQLNEVQVRLQEPREGMIQEDILAHELARTTKGLFLHNNQQYYLVYDPDNGLTNKYALREVGKLGGKELGIIQQTIFTNRYQDIKTRVVNHDQLPAGYIHEQQDLGNSMEQGRACMVIDSENGDIVISYAGGNNYDHEGKGNPTYFSLHLASGDAEKFVTAITEGEVDVRELLRNYIGILATNSEGNSLVPLNDNLTEDQARQYSGMSNPFATLDKLFIIDQRDRGGVKTFEIEMEDSPQKDSGDSGQGENIGGTESELNILLGRYSGIVQEVIKKGVITEGDLAGITQLVKQAKDNNLAKVKFRHSDETIGEMEVRGYEATYFTEGSRHRGDKVENQDACGVFEVGNKRYGIICDGVGGDDASSAKMAVGIVQQIIGEGDSAGQDLSLKEVVLRVNDELLNKGARGGSTIILFRLSDTGILEYTSVGDSPLLIINPEKGTVDILPRMNTIARAYSAQNREVGLESDGIDLAILDGDRAEINYLLSLAYQPEGSAPNYEQGISLAINNKKSNLRQSSAEIDEGKVQLERGDIIVASSDGFFPGNFSATELFIAIRAGLSINDMKILAMAKAQYDESTGRQDTADRKKADDVTAMIFSQVFSDNSSVRAEESSRASFEQIIQATLGKATPNDLYRRDRDSFSEEEVEEMSQRLVIGRDMLRELISRGYINLLGEVIDEQARRNIELLTTESKESPATEISERLAKLNKQGIIALSSELPESFIEGLAARLEDEGLDAENNYRITEIIFEEVKNAVASGKYVMKQRTIPGTPSEMNLREIVLEELMGDALSEGATATKFEERTTEEILEDTEIFARVGEDVARKFLVGQFHQDVIEVDNIQARAALAELLTATNTYRSEETVQQVIEEMESYPRILPVLRYGTGEVIGFSYIMNAPEISENIQVRVSGVEYDLNPEQARALCYDLEYISSIPGFDNYFNEGKSETIKKTIEGITNDARDGNVSANSIADLIYGLNSLDLEAAIPPTLATLISEQLVGLTPKNMGERMAIISTFIAKEINEGKLVVKLIDLSDKFRGLPVVTAQLVEVGIEKAAALPESDESSEPAGKFRITELFPSTEDALRILMGGAVTLKGSDILTKVKKLQKAGCLEYSFSKILERPDPEAIDWNDLLVFVTGYAGPYELSASDKYPTTFEVNGIKLDELQVAKLIGTNYLLKQKGNEYSFVQGKEYHVRQFVDNINVEPDPSKVSRLLWTFRLLNPDAELPPTIKDIMNAAINNETDHGSLFGLEQIAESISLEISSGRIKVELQDLSEQYGGLDVVMARFVEVKATEGDTYTPPKDNVPPSELEILASRADSLADGETLPDYLTEGNIVVSTLGAARDALNNINIEEVQEEAVAKLVRVLNRLDKETLRLIDFNKIGEQALKIIVSSENLNSQVAGEINDAIKRSGIVQRASKMRLALGRTEINSKSGNELEKYELSMNFLDRVLAIQPALVEKMPQSIRDFVKNRNEESSEKLINVLLELRRLLGDAKEVSSSRSGDEYEALYGTRPGLIDTIVCGMNRDELNILVQEVDALASVGGNKTTYFQWIIEQLNLVKEAMTNEEDFTVVAMNRSGMTSDIYYIDAPSGKYVVKAFAKGLSLGGSKSLDEAEVEAYQIPGIERHTVKTDRTIMPNGAGIFLRRAQILEPGAEPEEGLVQLKGLNSVLAHTDSRRVIQVMGSMAEFYKLAQSNGSSPGHDYKPDSYGFREDGNDLTFVTYDLGSFDSEGVPVEDYCEMLRGNVYLLEYFSKYLLNDELGFFDIVYLFGGDASADNAFLNPEQIRRIPEKLEKLSSDFPEAFNFFVRIYKTASKKNEQRKTGELAVMENFTQGIEKFGSLEEMMQEAESLTKVSEVKAEAVGDSDRAGFSGDSPISELFGSTADIQKVLLGGSVSLIDSSIVSKLEVLENSGGVISRVGPLWRSSHNNITEEHLKVRILKDGILYLVVSRGVTDNVVIGNVSLDASKADDLVASGYLLLNKAFNSYEFNDVAANRMALTINEINNSPTTDNIQSLLWSLYGVDLDAELPQSIRDILENGNEISEFDSILKRIARVAEDIAQEIASGKVKLELVDMSQNYGGLNVKKARFIEVEQDNRTATAADVAEQLEGPDYEELARLAGTTTLETAQNKQERYLPVLVDKLSIKKAELVSLRLSPKSQIELLLRRDISDEDEFERFTDMLLGKLSENQEYNYYLVADLSDDATSVVFYRNPSYQLSIPLSNGTFIPLEPFAQELLFMKGMLAEHVVRTSDGPVQKVLSLLPLADTVDSYLSMINPPKGAGFAHYQSIDVYADDPEAITINRVRDISDIQRLSFALSSELPEEIVEEIAQKSKENQGIVTKRMMFDVIDGKIQTGEYIVDKRKSYLSPEGIDLYEFVLVKNPDYKELIEQPSETVEGATDPAYVFQTIVGESDQRADTLSSTQKQRDAGKDVLVTVSEYTPVDLSPLSNLLRPEVSVNVSHEVRNKFRELLDVTRTVEIEDTQINSQQYFKVFINSLLSKLGPEEAPELKSLLNNLIRTISIKKVSKNWNKYKYRDFHYSLIEELLDIYNSGTAPMTVNMESEDIF